SNSEKTGGNRWLIGIIVILLVALCGAVCVGGGVLYFLMQPGGSPLAQPAPVFGATPVPGATKPAAGNQPAPTVKPPATGGKNILRLPGGTDPRTLDPAQVNDTNAGEYVAEIFSGLVMLDQNLKVVPDIAEKWDVSDDRKTYTFYLRKEVKFHDGRPVTAQDFKYSIERVANPATLSPTAENYLGDIVGVREKLSRKAAEVGGVQVVDDYTVKIMIDAPKSYFLAKLTFPTAYIVDKNNVERGGRTWTDKPNGTGPFKLKEYVRAQRIILAKNENYYGEIKPKLDEVQFILSGGSAMTMYENGDLESVYVTISDIERVSDANSPLNKQLYIGPALSTGFIVFNTRKPPFDDPKVRQAFALAIDRQKVIDVVYRKMPLVASTILPPGMPGYAEPANKLTYDPAKAKQLLAESKYAGKLPDITWTTIGAGGSAAQNVQVMAGMLKDNLGARVSIQQTDDASFFNTIDDPIKNPYHMFDVGWAADYVDPQNFLDILFRSTSTQNWASYSNLEVDKLLDQAALEKDNAVRFKVYQQVEQMILNDAPVIPLSHSREYWLTKPYVKGMIYPPMIIPRLKYISIER
ncbi:MAG: ABC transporter substrate-binding protein, partial [Anaerolineales bacterium]|nr:ABC transporter substrate-binding protein [Anaerolineales bacterium]